MTLGQVKMQGITYKLNRVSCNQAGCRWLWWLAKYFSWGLLSSTSCYNTGSHRPHHSHPVANKVENINCRQVGTYLCITFTDRPRYMCNSRPHLMICIAVRLNHNPNCDNSHDNVYTDVWLSIASASKRVRCVVACLNTENSKKHWRNRPVADSELISTC